MKCTQKVSSTVRKKINVPRAISKAMKISEIIDFLPGQLDPGCRDWEKKDLIFISDLFEGEILKSFSQIQEQFGLISTDFF